MSDILNSIKSIDLNYGQKNPLLTESHFKAMPEAESQLLVGKSVLLSTGKALSITRKEGEIVATVDGKPCKGRGANDLLLAISKEIALNKTRHKAASLEV